jgi:hypothetical protein
MKVYIIGKVTGLNYQECCDQFEEAHQQLEEMGHEVVNPIRIVPEGTPWIEAMKICLKALVDCDAYYQLPNSLSSRGALCEIFVACELKITQIH